MSDPWDDFAARISAPEGTNIYPAMAASLEVPAIVLVTDDPWIVSSGYSYDTEQYLAIALVEATAPEDGLAKLHALVHAIRDAGGDGYEIGDVSGVRSASIPDDGTQYLGSWVKWTYRDCDHAVEEGS
jgi:hypothetical protein